MSKIDDYKRSNNIAEDLSDEKLAEIGQLVVRGYHIDKESRSEWEHTMEESLKISKQIFEAKKAGMLSKAANVKFPLMTKGVIDFAARTYSEIIGGENVVFAKIIGPDVNHEKVRKAASVMKYMNYQLLEGMPEWEPGVDSLLMMLPVFGTVFKKAYYSPIEQRCVIDLVEPSHIVVNRSISSLETARRITHTLHLYPNDIIERQRAGIYCDFPIEDLQAPTNLNFTEARLAADQDKSNMQFLDEDAPLEILEQHCYLDLDEDDYKEPYVVTVDALSGKVLRILHRFKKIEKKNGKVSRIVPESYFIDYHFIKNPDGSFYSLGLGALLLPINESINTIINQLIDAGTLANLQGGFLGSGLRLKNGDIRLQAGEWKVLDSAMGEDIKGNIVPLPSKEPSPTLMNLLELLIGVGNDIASINDVMQGKQGATNVPATTIMTLLEQGMKVVSSIHKRVFLSLKKEYRRLFELNSLYSNDDEYAKVVDQPFAVVSVDFNMDELDIVPAADPNLSSDAQRLTRARALMELTERIPGVLDPRVVAKLSLEAMQYEASEIEALVPEPDPNAQPPAEDIKDMAQAQLFQAQAKLVDAQIAVAHHEAELGMRSSLLQEAEGMARIDKMRHDSAINQIKTQHVGDKLQDQRIKDINASINNDAKLALDNKKVDSEVQRELIKSETQINVAKQKPKPGSSST